MKINEKNNCSEIDRIFAVPLSPWFSKRVEMGIPGPVRIMIRQQLII